MKSVERPFAVSVHSDGENPAKIMVAGRDFHIDLERFVGHLSTPLTHRMLDLVRIASAVYAADRVSKRCRKTRRFLNISIELVEPGFWRQVEVNDLLVKCLSFVGGNDSWQLKFHRDKGAEDLRSNKWIGFPSDSEPPHVCLYSGGLDSAAGLASRLRAIPGRSWLPVVVWHQAGQRHLVLKQFKRLSEIFNVPLRPVLAKVWLDGKIKRTHQENSQRCRSFLFTSIGGVAAWIANAAVVEMFESGIGTINLPLMSGMIGWKSTRGSHPKFLRNMSALLSLAADKEITFQLPFLSHTKSDVVATLNVPELVELARLTVSCVHYPLRESDHKQCGTCPACIFRRQAMMIANIRESDQAYKYDLFGIPSRTNTLPEKELRYLKAFLMQVNQLSGLDGGETVPRFVSRHLLGTGVVAPGEPIDPILALYRRYRREWLDLISRGRTSGWPWADWVTDSRVLN